MRRLDPRRLPRRVRWALLLLPALVSGCYIVPVVPARPYYDRPYDGRYYHRRPAYPPPAPYFQGEFYYRSGEAEPSADGTRVASRDGAPAHIEASSISR